MGLNSFQTSGNSPGEAACRVAILGIGAVGSAVAARLTGPDSIPRLHLTHLCDRRARDKRSRYGDALADLVWTDRFDDLLASDADVIVEAVSAGEPAVDYVRAALLAGKSVVTANKQLIAHHAPALLSLAERQGRQLRFEAAVGGAMPVVRLLSDGLAGERIAAIDAILNGTSNFVLSRMESSGCSMDEAIAGACAEGYADVDPSVDLDGIDAAAKLSILCALAFGVRVGPEQIDAKSTARITPKDLETASQRGGTIRQIAHAAFDRGQALLTAWVAPLFVPTRSAFARAEGPQNVAVMTCTHTGPITISGQGAGSDASAVAIISDLVSIAKDRAAIVPAPILVEARTITGFPAYPIAEAV